MFTRASLNDNRVHICIWMTLIKVQKMLHCKKLNANRFLRVHMCLCVFNHMSRYIFIFFLQRSDMHRPGRISVSWETHLIAPLKPLEYRCNNAPKGLKRALNFYPCDAERWKPLRQQMKKIPVWKSFRKMMRANWMKFMAQF